MTYQRQGGLDPHLDPLRSPTVRGQHPHIMRASDDHTGHPSHQYQLRNQMGVYQPVPKLPALNPQQLGQVQPQKDNTVAMFALAGFGAFALWALVQLVKGDRTRNPGAPAPAAVPTTTVVMTQPAAQGAATPVVTTTPALLPPATTPAAEDAPKKKKKRTRRTTQARGPKGHYKRAGTRRKAVTEGKKK